MDTQGEITPKPQVPLAPRADVAGLSPNAQEIGAAPEKSASQGSSSEGQPVASSEAVARIEEATASSAGNPDVGLQALSGVEPSLRQDTDLVAPPAPTITPENTQNQPSEASVSATNEVPSLHEEAPQNETIASTPPPAPEAQTPVVTNETHVETQEETKLEAEEKRSLTTAERAAEEKRAERLKKLITKIDDAKKTKRVGSAALYQEELDILKREINATTKGEALLAAKEAGLLSRGQHRKELERLAKKIDEAAGVNQYAQGSDTVKFADAQATYKRAYESELARTKNEAADIALQELATEKDDVKKTIEDEKAKYMAQIPNTEEVEKQRKEEKAADEQMKQKFRVYGRRIGQSWKELFKADWKDKPKALKELFLSARELAKEIAPGVAKWFLIGQLAILLLTIALIMRGFAYSFGQEGK